MRIRTFAVAVLASAVLTACGGGSPSPPEGAPGTGPESTTTAGPEHPLPVELQGTWFLSTAAATNPVRIYLRETSYAAPNGHSGKVEAEGDVLTFTAICAMLGREAVGRYRWTLEGDTLHLDMIGKDHCGGRWMLADATFERTG